MKINEILKTLSQNFVNQQSSQQSNVLSNKSTTNSEFNSSNNDENFNRMMIMNNDETASAADGYNSESRRSFNRNDDDSGNLANLDGVRKRSRKPKHSKITKSVIEESLSNNLCELKHNTKNIPDALEQYESRDSMEQQQQYSDEDIDEYKAQYYYENDGDEQDDQYAEYQDEDEEQVVNNKENVDTSGSVRKRQRKSDSPNYIDEDETGKSRKKPGVQTKRRSEAEKELEQDLIGKLGLNDKKQRSKSLMTGVNLNTLSLNFPQLNRDDLLKSLMAASNSGTSLLSTTTAIPPAPVKRGPGRPPKYPRPSPSGTSVTDPLSNLSLSSFSSLDLASIIPLLTGANGLSSFTNSTGLEKKESKSTKSANLSQIIDTMTNKSGAEEPSSSATAGPDQNTTIEQSKQTTKNVKAQPSSPAKQVVENIPKSSESSDQQPVCSNESTIAIDQLKKAQFNTMAKLAYLNVCGQLSDSSLEFLLNEPTNKKSKKELVDQLINYIDSNLTNQVTSSPLFSLSIDVDHELTHLFVYIKFLNHEKISSSSLSSSSQHTMLNIQEKRLIKLIELKPSVRNFDLPMNDIKLSKYLFEQLKMSVILHYKLNKQNLMCLSVDNRLLNRICSTTLQLYLNDLFNGFILMVPSFSLHEPVAKELNAWSYNKMSLSAFLNTYQDICSFFKHNSVNKELLTKIDVNSHVATSSFDFNSLNKYWEITNIMCENYSSLIGELETSTNCPNQLNMTLNSSEFYLTSWILRDVFKFLCEFVKGSKNMNSLSPFWMQWNTPNLDHYANKKKVELEYEKIRDSMETVCRRLFDIHNSEYQKLINNYATMTTNPGSSDKLTSQASKPFAMLNIYQTLYSMFDIKIKSISWTDNKLEFTNGLEHECLETILEFYEFKNLIEFSVVQAQYKLFFDTYFERLSSEETEWLREQLKRSTQTNNESIFGTHNPFSLSLKEKFVKFVHENNKKQFAPVISFMAINYLCLPPMLTLNPLTIMSKPIKAEHQSQLDDKFWSDMECKFKLLNTIKSSYAIDLDDNCGFDLSDLPLVEEIQPQQPSAN